MKPKTPQSNKRPAALDKASSSAGLGVAELQTEFAKQLASVVPFLIKTAIVLGIGYMVYRKYTHRFVSKKENSKYPNANISDAQASSRAAAIEQSKTLFSNDFENVARNLSGLNYNGFIKLYNAFGKHTGTMLGGELDLIEWLQNQFSEQEISELSALLNGAFF
jgi:hypothetical protein